MKAILRPRVVEADQMANGNWLVEDGHDRRVYLPDDFHARFELDGCRVEEFSSRVCERGTRSCTVVHGG